MFDLCSSVSICRVHLFNGCVNQSGSCSESDVIASLKRFQCPNEEIMVCWVVRVAKFANTFVRHDRRSVGGEILRFHVRCLRQETEKSIQELKSV